jgi:replication factor A1
VAAGGDGGSDGADGGAQQSTGLSAFAGDDAGDADAPASANTGDGAVDDTADDAAGDADGPTEFTGTVVQTGDPVMLDDGSETLTVDTDADVRLGQEITVRGRLVDGRLEADEVL